MWRPVLRKTLNQWIMMYPDEMEHLFDDVTPPYTPPAESREIFPNLTPAEMLAYCQLRWGDLVLMPLGDDDMVGKIARMHSIILAQSKIIAPKWYYDFYLAASSPEDLTQNNWVESTDSTKTGEGSLVKSGGEYITHGETISSSTPGSTTSTFRTSTGENSNPRFERDVTVSSTDPTQVHSGTDYKGYEDANSDPYTESRESEEVLDKTVTHRGVMSKNPVEDNIKLKELGSNVYEKWIYDLIQVISTGTYQ